MDAILKSAIQKDSTVEVVIAYFEGEVEVIRKTYIWAINQTLDDMKTIIRNDLNNIKTTAARVKVLQDYLNKKIL